MLTIGLISLIFVTGASVYNIKQTERDLYNSLTAAAERASKPDGDKDKPEIGKDQPDRLAPTNVCVVKYTVDSFGATVVTTVSGNANLSADVVNKAAKAAAESAGYGQNSPRPQKKRRQTRKLRSRVFCQRYPRRRVYSVCGLRLSAIGYAKNDARRGAY